MGVGNVENADQAAWEDRLTFRWSGLPVRLPPVAAQAVLTRETPQDFEVEEIPAYLPAGQGEHLYVRVEKTGISTQEVARRLAAAGGVDAREVGFAGRKDVHAVARQTFSLPKKGWAAAQADHGPQFRVLEATPHKNKLQLGHLRGNTFGILLRRPVEGALDVLQARMAGVAGGLPNYFGPQRFGVDGRNAVQGWGLLTGRTRARDGRTAGLLVSAAQSHVFNHLLAARLRDDARLHPMMGDLLCKLANGAVFGCTDPVADAPRVDALEVAVTGPLPGSRMRAPSDAALTWESQVMADVFPEPTCFAKGRNAPVGDRRALTVLPTGLGVAVETDGLRVRFGLPSGCFATAILREWCGILEGADPE